MILWSETPIWRVALVFILVSDGLLLFIWDKRLRIYGLRRYKRCWGVGYKQLRIHHLVCYIIHVEPLRLVKLIWENSWLLRKCLLISLEILLWNSSISWRYRHLSLILLRIACISNWCLILSRRFFGFKGLCLGI